MNVPEHIAIILDGNGRWAKAKGMPRTYGHTVGAKNVETICRAAHDMGVKYVTMYAFSTENWSRPADEVKALMKLLGEYIKTCMKTAKKDNLRVRFIGDLSKLDDKLRANIKELTEYSSQFTGLTLTIAINYGSRDEMTRAIRNLASDVKAGEIQPEDIDEELFSSYLDTKDIPDPDFMIRTSGEQRLSNYLLWQLAYAEFYFTPVAWPDFTPDELKKAIEEYDKRNRRFGGI
ncbi:MAG: isoprenyl transferase [Pseudobutyrivibrio sp.]|jgi:undecaprenyl diphosphate synthase|uniref:isoprenyl transferase n=1 Tax=unclassified Pseudobutyrivibrio TaxID=2638619 RepID=UPI00088DB16C|nr:MULTISPECIES: isoprenyl transferase [unclassified Pseudobutyrivibrio]MBE5902757.1 isoprenyl transferase [Pseudobutyrivibrio sp.]SCX86349.1 undecaprenyl diphosphate synthase [Pseudobutyrivibrio sp. AR14]